MEQVATILDNSDTEYFHTTESSTRHHERSDPCTIEDYVWICMNILPEWQEGKIGGGGREKAGDDIVHSCWTLSHKPDNSSH